jgi:hypothetical protein
MVAMTTITEILTWPNEAVVEAVQGKITEVYDHKSITTKFGPNTVQNAVLEDIAGKKIRLSVWSHPDLGPLKGRSIILQSNSNRAGKMAGVKVKREKYTDKNTGQEKESTVLSVDKSGTFQFVEVHNANAPQADSKAPSAPSATPSVPQQGSFGQTAVNGAKVGMAINCATQFMTTAGEPFNIERVKSIASELIILSKWLEDGNLATNDPINDKAPDDEKPF